ncbi:hypothetical protein JYG30_04070 [Fibrella sp. USSR17]
MNHLTASTNVYPAIIRHYVAYHKFDEWGEYDTTKVEFGHWSNHPLSRLEKTISQRVWVVGGVLVGRKTEYKLLSYFTPETIEQAEEGGFWVDGTGVGFVPPVKLFSQSWWDILKREQANFSLGLNEIKNPLTINGLLALADKRNPMIVTGKAL